MWRTRSNCILRRIPREIRNMIMVELFEGWIRRKSIGLSVEELMKYWNRMIEKENGKK